MSNTNNRAGARAITDDTIQAARDTYFAALKQEHVAGNHGSAEARAAEQVAAHYSPNHLSAVLYDLRAGAE